VQRKISGAAYGIAYFLNISSKTRNSEKKHNNIVYERRKSAKSKAPIIIHSHPHRVSALYLAPL
jgi:hypothetical protein